MCVCMCVCVCVCVYKALTNMLFVCVMYVWVCVRKVDQIVLHLCDPGVCLVLLIRISLYIGILVCTVCCSYE